LRLVALLLLASIAHARPLVIAHRGASGYLPEHTLVAKAMAHAMHPDYIEQDVVLTRDNVPVVLHDEHLDTVTDVATLYPGRARADGRYYVIDFTSAEIRRLSVHERRDLKTGKAVYPKRFPTATELPLRVPTLDEEIALIRGLNASTGRDVGVYVELKAPAFHRREGRHIEPIVLDVMRRHGYADRHAKAYVQCFDPDGLARVRLIAPVKTVQLIGLNEWKEVPGVDYDAMLTPRGLARVARYADGIGPSIGQLAENRDGKIVLRTDIIRAAHRLGLEVHPYTLRVDQLPAGMTRPERLMDILFGGLSVDGVFTDFPDVAVRYLDARGR
jgi:glycerophosphoryl diester phosphodiesterase